MLKIATALWGFREMSLEQIIEACPEMGISRIEGHLHPEVPGHFKASASDAELKRILDLAKARGVSFATLATGNDFTVSAERNKADLEWLKTCVRFAKRIDVDIIRVFSGFSAREKVVGGVWDAMIENLAKAAAFAKENGVTLALENHGGIAADADDMLKILKAVGNPALKLNFDPANFVHAGEDCVKAFPKLKGEVVYVHLKDVKREADGKMEYCACGEGIIDWKALLPLIEAAYDGVSSIEYEEAADPIEGTMRSLKFIKTLAKTK
jgi:sugar phosphate isomerase/epimerase